MLFHIFCIRHRNICLTFAFCTLLSSSLPLKILSLSCRRSCRGCSEAHRKLGVQLYWEYIGSKIVGDVKIALYCQRSVSLLCDGEFLVENKAI